jgi:integral membrane protein
MGLATVLTRLILKHQMSPSTPKDILIFLRIGLLEAASYLLLLGLAMPLKYLAKIPEPVKYLGWAHGLLFVGYLCILGWLVLARKWPFYFGILGFIAALLPLGPYVFERYLRKQGRLV